MNKPRPVLRLYTRANCHLCDVMKRELRELEHKLEFRLEVHDVDAQAGNKEKFGDLVPVLLWGRDVICYHQLDQNLLARALGKEIPKN
ncbi:MAG TPA: glutaredoxin family protein [Gammaproteobacteria bacterium]|nr:glutaredoxin family protein [Gammaproteobacteria bacterium]